MASLLTGAPAASSSSIMASINQSPNRKVIMYMVIAIAISFLIAYTIYYVINSTISSQQSYLIPESMVPLDARGTVPGSTTLNFSGSKIPPSVNGHRGSISFWIFINDIQVSAGVNRHVLHRGTETSVIGTANPYIYLDSTTNKMYVTYAANDTSRTFKSTINGTPTDYTTGTGPFPPQPSSQPTDAQIKFMNAVRGIEIPYIPLQRWVHVVVVINEDATIGGSISAYVDSELVNSVTSTSSRISGLKNDSTPSTAALLSPQPIFNITDVAVDMPGDIYLGGSINSPYGPGFSGMISMISFYNYDLNANDVYNIYKKGPINNLLAKLGLPAYGIQSPIYRVG
jgi:hypothetical protein